MIFNEIKTAIIFATRHFVLPCKSTARPKYLVPVFMRWAVEIHGILRNSDFSVITDQGWPNWGRIWGKINVLYKYFLVLVPVRGISSCFIFCFVHSIVNIGAPS